MSLNEKLTGAESIRQERVEHTIKHGITIEDDVANNKNDELLVAARRLLAVGDGYYPRPPQGWSEDLWRHMCSKNRRDRNVISGSFIAAQIDVDDYKAGVRHLRLSDIPGAVEATKIDCLSSSLNKLRDVVGRLITMIESGGHYDDGIEEKYYLRRITESFYQELKQAYDD